VLGTENRTEGRLIQSVRQNHLRPGHGNTTRTAIFLMDTDVEISAKYSKLNPTMYKRGFVSHSHMAQLSETNTSISIG
jgi:hypothetical protein